MCVKTKFKSKISPAIYVALVIYHLLIVGIFVSSYFLYYKGLTNSLGAFLIVVDVVFLLPLIFKTYYVLEDKTLFIHQWPFIRIRIGYGNIFEIDNKPVEKNKKVKRATLSNEKLVIGYYKYSAEDKTKEERYVEISPAEMDLFLIKMGGHFKRAREIAAKLEEEHKQRNEEHFRKKALADKARQEKEEQNKPVDVVVKAVKKGEVKTSVEDENTEE